MRNYKEELLEMGNYMIMHDSFQLLPKNECALLTYLVDAEDYCKKIEQKKLGEDVFDDMFPEEFEFEAAFHSFVSKKLIAWTKQEYKTALDGLASKGYIYRFREDNSQPWKITLNYEALDLLAETWKKVDIILSYKAQSRNYYSQKIFGLKFNEALQVCKNMPYTDIKEMLKAIKSNQK